MNYKTIFKIFLVMAIVLTAMSCVSAESPLVSDGKYKVGDDIPAGDYYVKCNTYNLYIAVSSDSSGDLDSVIYNLNTHGGVYITVEDGEYLEIQGGDLYELDDTPNRGAEDGHYKEGMYKVGDDIPAGDYTVKSTEEQAYIEITTGTRHQVEDIVENDNFKTDKKITLKDGQYLILRNGAQIDVDDKDTSSDKDTSAPKASTKKVVIEGVSFNLPDGYKEDKSAAYDDYKQTLDNGVVMVISEKTFLKGSDNLTFSVISYEGAKVDDSVIEQIAGDSKKVNGVKGYDYDIEGIQGFAYAKDGKMISIVGADDDLLKEIVVK